MKDQCRSDIRKYLFSQRSIYEWNTLTTDCATASSVKMFKNKVDTYLRKKNVGISISQWLPYPHLIWAFAFDGSLVKSC